MKLGARDNSSPLLPTSSPFVRRVQQETIPKKFMMLTMTAYDGTGNPWEYVLNYKTFMELQTNSDALMCKVFVTTLIGPARAWFNSLKVGSIKSFIDLASVFISIFITRVPAKRKMSYLKTIRQRRNESLREYVAKFNSETLQIPELDEGRVVEAMQKGTTSPEFFGLLCRKPSTSLSELMKRAKKYIRQDGTLTTNQFAKDDRDRGRVGEDKRQDRLERRQDWGPEALNKHWWERKEQRPYQSRLPAEITLLNMSRAEVLMAVQDKDFIQRPKPMKVEANRRDLDKYCQYHRTHGHDTNDCYQLINEIERLIKRCHL
ncbi:hypothetical protein MANES_14G158232v8 [Manihot esculenta]|uniref:Uncharacterized protein n=1 Tax=Manihot esculenta TaxID=3983 RepID=A0ACB7GI16_MANES|nr:hypothetical protein MANES_14G158232v8 [Manihot esculenta]